MLSENPLTIEIDGQPHKIDPKKVVGSTEWPFVPGDRVRVLVGYFWCNGTVTEEPLMVRLDSGKLMRCWNANNVKYRRELHETI